MVVEKRKQESIILKIKKKPKKEKGKDIKKWTNLKKQTKIKRSLERYYRLKKEREEGE